MVFSSKNLKKIVLALLLTAVAFSPLLANGSQEDGPKKTRLNVGWTAGQSLESTILDENWQYLEMGCILWQLCYDQLWIMGDAEHGYEPQPMVAKSWDVSDDMKSWTFHLRDDVYFSDGVQLTAKDIEFTFDKLPKAEPSFDMVDFDYEKIEVIDDFTIKFIMKNPFGMPYPPMFWCPILPKHIWEQYQDDFKANPNEDYLGSGPFKLKEFKAGQYIWLEANEDYWGKKPGVDELVFKIFGTEDTRDMAMRNGDIDMIGYLGVGPLSVEYYKNNPDISIMTSPDINIYWLNFNLHQEKGIQDIAVRQAIMHSIDVNRIIDMALLGYGEPADSFVYKELDWYNEDVTNYDFDIDKANAILDAAGYVDTDGDGIRNEKDSGEDMTYELLGNSDQSAEVKVVTMMKEMISKIGIDVELKIVDLDTYYNYMYAPDEDYFDLALMTEGPGPNGEWFWDFCRGWDNGGAGWNTAYYTSEAFDTAMDNMLAASNMEEKNMYRKEMQKIISDDIPYGILYRKDIICPVNTSKFTGFTATMGGTSVWINPWSFFNVQAKSSTTE